MKTFKLPDLGEGLQDAEIVSWHVSVGDRVVADQPLVAVETEKAVVEVPAPWSGVLSKLYAEPGDIVAIGSPLADFEEHADREDAGSVVGQLEQEDSGSAAAPAPASEPEVANLAAAGRGVKAAPAVRKLAGSLGVDLSGIGGTGPQGAITREDVEQAAAVSAGEAGDWEPLRGVRRNMARNMARAHAEVAATTVTDEANIAGWPDLEDVTVRLARAIMRSCEAEPALNAWYDPGKNARQLHERVDLGLAVNTEDGLFVPVLRDVGNRSDEELASGLEAMKADIAARSVPPEELRDQTITLSNFGMYGGRHAALIVMPSQVAIIGAGRIAQEPRVRGGEICICPVLPLSLTFDHRAVTGAEAARFVSTLIKVLEGLDG